MNAIFRWLLRAIVAFVMLHLNPGALFAAVSFTRVTGDPVVSDGGLSRGIVFVDYDGDKYPDVYVVNSAGGAEFGGELCAFALRGRDKVLAFIA